MEPPEVETAAELLPETPAETSAADNAAQAGEAPATFEETMAELSPEMPAETSAADDAAQAGEAPATFEETEPVSDDEAFEPDEEIDNLLRRKRWKQRQGPFRGFGSPPGKF